MILAYVGEQPACAFVDLLAGVELVRATLLSASNMGAATHDAIAPASAPAPAEASVVQVSIAIRVQ